MTPAACVIGWPLGHSRSPLIHSYWLKQYSIDGEYRREAVKPEGFVSFVATLASRGYRGANVTLPHKEMALTLAQPDEKALAVGAANTLWYDAEGALRATNTDVEGFLGNLDESVPGWDAGLEDAVVLGAGGAARAVIFGLVRRGVKRIHLVNRNTERAATLAARFGSVVQAAGWKNAPTLLRTSSLLVNTTSLGMAGQPPLEIALPARADLIVGDIVYDPLQTTLLRDASSLGMRTADGLGMLLHQAVRGFELWFGVRPRVTRELRDLVEADLRG